MTSNQGLNRTQAMQPGLVPSSDGEGTHMDLRGVSDGDKAETAEVQLLVGFLSWFGLGFFETVFLSSPVDLLCTPVWYQTQIHLPPLSPDFFLKKETVFTLYVWYHSEEHTVLIVI